MDRLIEPNYIYNDLDFIESGMAPYMNRLAAYEDTGLTPEEVVSMASYIDQYGYVSIPDKYSQAEDEGRLIVSPCKVGDTIYIIIDDKIHEGEVYHISYSNYYGKITTTVWTKGGVGASFDHFGKCAFLAREEAEGVIGGEA